MSSNSVRVVVCDDSAVVRGMTTRALESHSDIEVVGSATNGQILLNLLPKTEVDVVVLDVEMPVLDGLTTLKQLQQLYPHINVIMSSSLTRSGASTAIKALTLGASSCVGKPEGASPAETVEILQKELLPLILELGLTKQRTQTPIKKNTLPNETRPTAQPKALVIGSSTGGPQALSSVFAGLQAPFPLPILIAQHMPPVFTKMLGEQLQRDTGHQCNEAQEGEVIQPGKVYIAPGGYHLEVRKDPKTRIVTAHLNEGPKQHSCRPSVNPLFQSASQVWGENLLALMLTGMGEDGIEGTGMIREKRGFVVAQNEATSVVWGMPGAVVNAGLANQVLPLKDIAVNLNQYCHSIKSPALV